MSRYKTFQSGISLSICLHPAGRLFLVIVGMLFQSGISLSICLHIRWIPKFSQLEIA